MIGTDKSKKGEYKLVKNRLPIIRISGRDFCIHFIFKILIFALI